MFFVFYAIPISIFFFLNLILTGYGIYRLRKIVTQVGNKTMVRLVRRLIPFSLIFCFAFLPTAVFFLRGYVTDHEDDVNKTFAILGQVLSGTFYALCYSVMCYVDYTYVSAATKRINAIELANESVAERSSSVSIISVEDELRASMSDAYPFTTGETHNPIAVSSKC
jgi:hypothetical protein